MSLRDSGMSWLWLRSVTVDLEKRGDVEIEEEKDRLWSSLQGRKSVTIENTLQLLRPNVV